MQPIPYFGEELNLSDWVWEPKVDGWRMQVLKHKGKTTLFGRRLESNPDWTERLAHIAKIADGFLPHETLLDCELCSTKGRRFIPSLFAKNKKAEPVIYVFDIVFLNGDFVGDLPLYKRRQLLSKLKLEKPFTLIPQREIKGLASALKEAIEGGNEGIVIKEVNSKYLIAKDGPIATEWWRKIKG